MRKRVLKIVILSRKRTDSIRENTLKLLPDAYVCVDSDEEADYAKIVSDDRLLLHPQLTRKGLGAIHNWVLDNVECDALAFVADDHQMLMAMPGWSSRRYTDPAVIEAAIAATAQCAVDAGTGLFGWAANPNPVIYEPGRPIKLARWVTAPFGFVGDHGLRYDERLSLMEDVDVCLQSLMKHRIIWCDSRWCLVGKALTNTGGSAFMRSEEAFAKERAILKEKWGPYIRFDTEAVHSSERYKKGLPATTMMTYVYVPRRQPMF